MSMLRGQGDSSGLRAADSAVGRVGQLACWERNNLWPVMQDTACPIGPISGGCFTAIVSP
jgi:hypothetical protein